MKGTIIDTHHCIEIDNVQLDLFYNFITSELNIYIDGVYYITGRFAPSRQILSYSNVLDVAVTYYTHWQKRQQKINQEIT